MNFLFPTPFFGIDNFLSEDAVKDLHNQILEDVSKNEGYVNSQWDCLVNTSAQRDASVTYPIFSFKEAYEEFSSQLHLSEHQYELIHPWYNFYTKGQNQEPHTHLGTPNCMFSGVYFLKGTDNTRIVFSNPSQNWLNYHSYEYTHHPVAKIHRNIPEHSYVMSKYVHEPRDNQIIFFPSYLSHYVPAHRFDTPRITISFNIELRE